MKDRLKEQGFLLHTQPDKNHEPERRLPAKHTVVISFEGFGSMCETHLLRRLAKEMLNVLRQVVARRATKRSQQHLPLQTHLSALLARNVFFVAAVSLRQPFAALANLRALLTRVLRLLFAYVLCTGFLAASPSEQARATSIITPKSCLQKYPLPSRHPQNYLTTRRQTNLRGNPPETTCREIVPKTHPPNGHFFKHTSL